MARNLSLRRPPPKHTFTLPRAVLARLLIFCGENRERPADVVADAVALHLDELETHEHRTAEACATGGSGPASLHTGGTPPSDDQVEVPNFLRRRS